MTRVGLLGAGAIGTFILESVDKGWAGDARVVAVAGRGAPQGRAVAQRFGVPYIEPHDLPRYDLRVIVEAAGHAAVQAFVPEYLRQGIDVIMLSAGALTDDGLLALLLHAARAGGSRLRVPSGGIAALDGIKALALAGADISLVTAKPPQAWKGVASVETMGLDLDGLTEPVVLFEGPARQACALFPQNVNIAAALSLAGVGFDRTSVRVIADPGIDRNIHEISAEGPMGRIQVRLENVPNPANPKTAYLACLSAVALLREMTSPIGVGT